MKKTLISGAARSSLLAGLIAVLAVTAGCGEPSEAELLASARQQLAKQDGEAAKLQIKTLLQKNPQSGDGRLMLGQLLLASGDAAGAEAELARALELGQTEVAVLPLLADSLLAQGKGALLLQRFGRTVLPDAKADASLRTQLAAAEAQGGNTAGAEAQLALALRARPDHAPALLLKARLLAASGDQPGALAQVNSLLAQQADLADAWMLKGELLQASKPADKTDTLAAYAQAITLRPALLQAHNAVIMIQLAKPDLDAAALQLAALQKVAPKHPQTLFMEALLADQRGEHERVRELTQLLLRGNPASPPLLMLAGQAELKLNALAQAEAFFTKASQLVPKAAPPRLQLAQVQLRTGQADKALITLKPLLDGDTPDAKALTLAGQAKLLIGDKKGADANFARAAKLQPTDTRVRTTLALSQLAGGQDTAGLAALQDIAAGDKGNTADLALITAQARRGDNAGALKAVAALAAKMPGKALPDHVRGRLALQRGDMADARKQFELALTKEADYMPALAGLAALDLADKQPAAARARFDAALQRNPKNMSAMLALAEINARTGGKPEDTVQLLEQAIKTEPANAIPRLMLVDHQLGSRNPKLAFNASQAGLAALPDNSELLDRQGRALMALGEAQQAVSTFSRLATLNPRSPMPQLRLADAQALAKNSSATAAAVRRAAEIAPKDPQVQQALFSLALMEGKPAQALAVARTVQAQRPDAAVGFNMEGDAELRQKHWDAAAAALRKARTLKDPGDATQRLHAALLAGKKTAEADKLAAEQQQAKPGDMGFVMYLGDAALASGNSAQAEQHYQQVLDKQPDSVLALNNLAYTLAAQKKPGAVALAEKAQKLAPTSAAVMDTLAFSLAAENQLSRAIEMQTKAVTSAPEAPQFRLQLAKLQLQAGDKASARTELNTLARLGPAFGRQTEVAELLKSSGS